jgi:hypothetical protein
MPRTQLQISLAPLGANCHGEITVDAIWGSLGEGEDGGDIGVSRNGIGTQQLPGSAPLGGDKDLLLLDWITLLDLFYKCVPEAVCQLQQWCECVKQI